MFLNTRSKIHCKLQGILQNLVSVRNRFWGQISVRNRFCPPPAKADIATAILTHVIEHLVLLLPPNKHAFTAKAVWADFQMICQKLCQNSCQGGGRLKYSVFSSPATQDIARRTSKECGQFQNGSVTNYVQTVSFDPARRVAPCHVSEVSQIMSEAKTEGIKVKAVGGCASLEAVATTHGVLIETYKLTSIEEEMRRINGKRAFWLGAGVTVSQAIEYLREQNMALADNGGWTGQTIVGAVMTGTHGSDLNFPPNSDFIRAIHFVMSDGRQYVFEPKGGRFQQGDFGSEVTLVQDDDEFYSSVVTVGSLGVVVRILFEPLPYYYVFQKVVKSTVPKLLAGELDEFRAEYDNINLVINPFNSEVGSFKNHQKPWSVDGQLGGLFWALF